MDIGSLTGQITLEDELSSALTIAADKVKKFADKFEGTFGVMAIGAGVAVTAISAVTGAIIALGNRGADVNDVAATFDHFSGSVENAQMSLEAMQKGTLNTVDDMDLMKDASKLLAAGVSLTSEQFGTLSSAAFVLQNQGLGPTKDMLDLVSQALLTGRTRALEMKIGKIDLAKAEKDYAASLGVDKLTKMQKVEADRIGILEALNRKVKEAGIQQRDFGESMEAALVVIKNWGDELASAVAKSTHVTGAVDAIGKAFVDAFGSDSDKLLNNLVLGINKFADAVTTYGPRIIQFTADVYHGFITLADVATDVLGPPLVASFAVVTSAVKTIYDGYKTLQDLVEETWHILPDWAKEVAKDAALAAVAIYGINTALKIVTATETVHMLTEIAGAAGGAITQIGGVYNALKVYYLLGSFAGGGVSGGVAGILTGISYGFSLLLVPTAIAASIAALAASIWQVVKAWNAWKEASAGGTSFGTFITRQDKDNWVRRLIPGLSTQNMPNAPSAPNIGQAGGAMSHVNIQQGGLTGIMPTKVISEADSAAAEEYAKKLEAMQQKFKDASLEGRLFADMFKSLTPAQKASYDIQQLLVPDLEKMVEAHKALTPSMQEVLKSSTALEQAYLAQEDSVLQLSGLTQESVDRAKEQGISEAQVAASYGVSTKALGLYLAEKKKDQTISQNLATFEAARVKDEADYQQRRVDIEKQGNKTLADAHKQYLDMVNKQTMTSEEYQASIVARTEAENVAAFKGTAAQAEAYVKEQAAIASAAYADIATASAEAAASGADDAQQVSNAWKKTYTSLGNVATILDAIPGKFAEVGAIAARTGTAIMDNLAQGNTLGAVIAGVTGGIAALTKLIGVGPTEYEKRMKKAVDETKSLQAELIKSHGSMQRLISDADIVGINIKAAFDWKDPEAFKNVVEDLNNKTNLLNGAMQEYGFTWQDLGEKGRAAKLGELFDELKAKTDILQGAGIDYDTILQRQAKDYSDLVSKAIASGTEIPESMRPTLEKLAEMGDLFTEVKDEQGNVTKKFIDLKDVSWAKTMTEGFKDVTNAIHDLTDALLKGVGGAMDTISGKKMVIRSEFDTTTPGSTEPLHMAGGGRVLPWRPRGTDTVPAMLTPGETVIPAGRSADQAVTVPVILKVGNEAIAKQMVKTFVRGGL